MIELDKYDLDTKRLILRSLSDKYGKYEMAAGKVFFKDGSPTQDEIDVIALDLVKQDSINKINGKAEDERIRHIGNSGIGMVMIYIQRNKEASACLADDNPTNEKYPFLAVELGYYGATLKDVAKAVVTASQEWVRKGIMLEQMRRRTQKQIKDAETISAVKNIVAAVDFKVE